MRGPMSDIYYQKIGSNARGTQAHCAADAEPLTQQGCAANPGGEPRD
jgi:hypothetical protein